VDLSEHGGAPSGMWTYVCSKKKSIRQEIDQQLGLGFTGLLEYDRPLSEIQPPDLNASNGEDHRYWLLVMMAVHLIPWLPRDDDYMEHGVD